MFVKDSKLSTSKDSLGNSSGLEFGTSVSETGSDVSSGLEERIGEEARVGIGVEQAIGADETGSEKLGMRVGA